MNLPAICDNCGMIFPSTFSGGGGAKMLMFGCKSGPCPKCGSMGYVPDGAYRLINEVIEILGAPEYSKSDLELLVKVLNKSKMDDISLEKAKGDIAEKAPRLSKIFDLLPKTRGEKRDDIKFAITTILATLAIVIPLKSSNASTVNNINVEQVINNIYQYEAKGIEPIREDKVGRNELCPCGSGLKYKYCHGDWRRELIETDSNNIEFE